MERYSEINEADETTQLKSDFDKGLCLYLYNSKGGIDLNVCYRMLSTVIQYWKSLKYQTSPQNKEFNWTETRQTTIFLEDFAHKVTTIHSEFNDPLISQNLVGFDLFILKIVDRK